MMRIGSPLMTDSRRYAINTAETKIVTGDTADNTAPGEPWLKIKFLPSSTFALLIGSFGSFISFGNSILFCGIGFRPKKCLDKATPAADMGLFTRQQVILKNVYLFNGYLTELSAHQWRAGEYSNLFLRHYPDHS